MVQPQPGLGIEPAGQAQHALGVNPGPQPARPPLTLQATPTVISLHQADLGGELPAQLRRGQDPGPLGDPGALVDEGLAGRGCG